jgi:hypothetical protein
LNVDENGDTAPIHIILKLFAVCIQTIDQPKQRADVFLIHQNTNDEKKNNLPVQIYDANTELEVPLKVALKQHQAASSNTCFYVLYETPNQQIWTTMKLMKTDK